MLLLTIVGCSQLKSMSKKDFVNLTVVNNYLKNTKEYFEIINDKENILKVIINNDSTAIAKILPEQSGILPLNFSGNKPVSIRFLFNDKLLKKDGINVEGFLKLQGSTLTLYLPQKDNKGVPQYISTTSADCKSCSAKLTCEVFMDELNKVLFE